MRHSPLTDADIADLRALCSEASFGADETAERLRGYASHLILDLVAVQVQLRSQQRRARSELERLHDVLGRARPHLVGGRRSLADDELGALLAEIDDVLARPRW